MSHRKHHPKVHHHKTHKRPHRLKRWLGYLLMGIVAVALIDGAYLFFIWPDWETLSRGAVPKSNFIRHYEELRADDAKLPALRWQPVAMGRIAPIMGRAAIVAEDSRFYVHEGIDTEAIQEAMEKNLEKGKIVYGASTISQQTVKNMFLSSSRDYLRKWHELLLTWSMERNLPKKRILEIYLNVAEFGPGVYGVEAASRYYWGISAASLSSDQAAQLSACLPSPKKHNPNTATRDFQRRVARIKRHMHRVEDPAAEEARVQSAAEEAITDEVATPNSPAEGATQSAPESPAATPTDEAPSAGDAPAPAAADPARETPTATPQ